ncbi:MAG: hypothetical protein DCF26_09535 [Burkholderiales bacterium]|nr:MAG: hypothetical protein DCF26_09535 [Burkholderiales bacterium]
MPTTIQETTEDLHKAWRLLRRPCWPDTYEATVQDPIRARLVQMYAHQLALAAVLIGKLESTAAAPFAPRQPERRTQPAMPTLFRPLPTMVDRKRAAAGDRDD